VGTGLTLPTELAEQIEHILVELHRKTEAECILLADASGRLISSQGRLQEIDPLAVAALGAADVVATSELIRQIGGQDPDSALLREGRYENVYLFDVANCFVLIVIFRAGTLANLVRLYSEHAVEQLCPLVAEFERWMNKPIADSNANFAELSRVELGATLVEETDTPFERTIIRGATSVTKQKRDHRGAEKWRRFYFDARERLTEAFRKAAKHLRRPTSAPEQQPPDRFPRHHSGEPIAVAGRDDVVKMYLSQPDKLAAQIEHILTDLRGLTQAQCILLSDVNGQLINIQGEMQEIDPAIMAILGAADVAATTELIRQIGGRDPGSALFRQGRHVNIYLFDVASRFVLSVVFQTGTLAGLVHSFGRRAAERLRPLAVEFEDQMNRPTQVSDVRFGAILAEEMDKAFEGL
jgi:predicted regulator of Ras-like GTPase activity (Roadblock/LC7/MglB family)